MPLADHHQDIERMWREGVPAKRIAKEFNVSPGSLMTYICNYRRRHIEAFPRRRAYAGVYVTRKQAVQIVRDAIRYKTINTEKLTLLLEHLEKKANLRP
jgi:transposase